MPVHAFRWHPSCRVVAPAVLDLEPVSPIKVSEKLKKNQFISFLQLKIQNQNPVKSVKSSYKADSRTA